ncbi:MAG TPA: glycosyltransferase [Gemmatimonadaceae bacterium]|nr:glycosyltransferase [Gemmatimonadaceae bacterium]
MQAVDSEANIDREPGLVGLWHRGRSKLGYPADRYRECARLIAAAEQHRPDVVFVDASRVLTRGTLRKVRAIGDPTLVYYIPDDVMARHNQTRQRVATMRDWDIFFTTKTFNVPELAAHGVREPTLIGNSFDPALHRPMTPADVGPEYEQFDVVFVGSYEGERCDSVNALAEAGINVIVFGSDWPRRQLDARVQLREGVYAEEYSRCMHFGKVALNFLRKINRDRITTRSIEVPAMARPVVGERSDEHDAHFVDGTEYLGFSSDRELVAHVKRLLADDVFRRNLALAGRQRCLASGYSTLDRAQEMMNKIIEVRSRTTSRTVHA